jgi:hypothetical protein
MSKPIPHKHAAIIREWALNPLRVVQHRVGSSPWDNVGTSNNPCWYAHVDYRFKPEQDDVYVV